MARGTCVCGAVEFDVRPPFRFFQYCHCSRCRKRSGSIHAANIAVLVDDFSWVRGEEHAKRFELPAAKSWSNCFCDVCGSALPWKNRAGTAFIVPAGGLDEPPASAPTRNIHYGSRAAWHIDAASLPVFEGEPPKT